MNLRALLIFCLFSLVSSAQQLETGVIIDSIPVTNSSNESFTLYLPIAYKADIPSPVLIVFSPSGNGKKGVETFVKAAETYNHIIICSNNSRNGSLDRNISIAQRLFNHVFSNFKINENRIYLAGFSGGSRLATAIATQSDQITGVIACGAGFIANPSYMPSKQNFAYAGICGDRDMNFKEMVGVRKYLNRLNHRNTLFTFEGGHKWPPIEQILMAFAWLEIESLKKGHLKKPQSEVMKGYSKHLEGAEIALKNNQPLLAAAYYERIVNTYGSFFNLDSVSQKLQNIKKDKVYIKTLKSREKAFNKEDVWTAILLKRFDSDYENPENANLNWWDSMFKKLSKRGAKADSEMYKMTERLRFKVFVAAYMKNNSDSGKPRGNQLAFCKALVSQLYPKPNKEEL